MCVNKKNKGVKQAIVQFSPLRGWSSALFHYAALVFCCHATLQTHPISTTQNTLFVLSVSHFTLNTQQIKQNSTPQHLWLHSHLVSWQKVNCYCWVFIGSWYWHEQWYLLWDVSLWNLACKKYTTKWINFSLKNETNVRNRLKRIVLCMMTPADHLQSLKKMQKRKTTHTHAWLHPSWLPTTHK